MCKAASERAMRLPGRAGGLPGPGLIIREASSNASHIQLPRGRCGAGRIRFCQAGVMPGERGKGAKVCARSDFNDGSWGPSQVRRK